MNRCSQIPARTWMGFEWMDHQNSSRHWVRCGSNAQFVVVRKLEGVVSPSPVGGNVVSYLLEPRLGLCGLCQPSPELRVAITGCLENDPPDFACLLPPQ